MSGFKIDSHDAHYARQDAHRAEMWPYVFWSVVAVLGLVVVGLAKQLAERL